MPENVYRAGEIQFVPFKFDAFPALVELVKSGRVGKLSRAVAKDYLDAEKLLAQGNLEAANPVETARYGTSGTIVLRRARDGERFKHVVSLMDLSSMKLLGSRDVSSRTMAEATASGQSLLAAALTEQSDLRQLAIDTFLPGKKGANYEDAVLDAYIEDVEHPERPRKGSPRI